jgi:AhpD family alkylhydroperoxidase
MDQRINYLEHGQEALKAMFGLGKYIAKSSIEPKLLHLVEFRVSQINGCSYCLDMHSKDLRHDGETEQRLYLLEAWRETSLYTDRERAALEWAEAVTLVSETHVPDNVYEIAKKQFSEKELIELTMDIVAVNSWNRLNIAFRTTPGTYQPGQWASAAS